MRLRHLLASSCLAALAALHPSIGSANAWIPAPKEYWSDVRFGVFAANDFHGANGVRNYMAGGGHLEERRLTLTNELGWKKNMSFLLALPFQQVRREFDGGGGITATGGGDMLLGVRYRLAGGAQHVVSLEAGWKAPLGYDAPVRLPRDVIAYFDTVFTRGYSPADSANAMRQLAPPRLGQGQQDLQGVVRFGWAFPHWNGFFQGAAGYRYRFDEPNDQILLGSDIAYWLTDRLLISGHYDGTIAMNEDDFDANGYQEQLVGPRLTVRVDDRFDIYGGSLHSAGAENAPHKDLYYVGFTMKQTGLDRFQGFLGGTRRP